MIYRFFFTFLFLLMLSGLQAQVLELRYQTEAVAENQWETTLSLQALQEDSLIVRAVNFTFLSDSGCARFPPKNLPARRGLVCYPGALGPPGG
jgi:hypothetical protein